MLVIAQPRSASTSLMDTIGKVAGVRSCQKFNGGGKSYKKLFNAPDGYGFLQHHHSDFRKIPFTHVLDRINNTSTVFKQHFPPTKEILDGIKESGKHIVILLRDPEHGMESYKKLGAKKYKESLSDLKLFYNGYKSLEGLPNVLIVDFDDVTNNTVSVLTRILNHFRLPVPASISEVVLSRKRTSTAFEEYLKGKRVAFVGPAPTLGGKGLGKKIDGYDVVIRMKQPIIPDSKQGDYGKQTNVIYGNFDAVAYKGAIRDHYAKWKAHGLSWAIMARRKKSRKERAINSGIKGFFSFRRVTKAFYKNCKKKCSCRGRNIPFTGTVALMEVIRTQYKELYITGFDYYQSTKNGDNGHYEGFNPDEFEKKVDYKKHYNTIYSSGSSKYRHNAKNDIKALRKVVSNARALGKSIELGEDFSGVLKLEQTG